MVERTESEKQEFIHDMQQLLAHTKNTCKIVGKIWQDQILSNPGDNISFYDGFDNLIRG